jgi:hypothetical protein
MANTLNDDAIMRVADRLENTGAVVRFLGEATTAICAREEPLTSTAEFGMGLIFQWIESDIKFAQDFIRQSA